MRHPVFCISMQRSGTTSVGDWLQAHGLRRSGFDVSRANGWTRSWLAGDIEAIFTSPAFADTDVFEDDPWWCPDFYRVVAERFPEARFVLLERDPHQWYDSLCAHSHGRNPGWTDVHARIYGREDELQSLLADDPALDPSAWNLLSVLDRREHYEAHYLRHHREVREYFASQPGRLFHGPLDDPRSFHDMLEFLGIERDRSVAVPRSNATPAARRGTGSAVDSPVVTVLVPTYDHETSLAAALDSILAQRTDFPFVVLVAEDASTDGTPEIVRQYAERYPGRVIARLNEHNLGPLRNVQAALATVDSPYWAFLEGDDEWCDPHKLQLQVDALEAHPGASMCGHETRCVYHRPSFTGRVDEQLHMRDLVRTPIKELYEFGEPGRVHTSARVYRNLFDYTTVPPELLVDVGCWRLHLQRGPLVYIDRVMSTYHWTGTGLWTGARLRDRKLMELKLLMVENEYYGFAHDALLSPPSRSLARLKRLLGTRWGWRVYYRLQRARWWVRDLVDRARGRSTRSHHHQSSQF